MFRLSIVLQELFRRETLTDTIPSSTGMSPHLSIITDPRRSLTISQVLDWRVFRGCFPQVPWRQNSARSWWSALQFSRSSDRGLYHYRHERHSRSRCAILRVLQLTRRLTPPDSAYPGWTPPVNPYSADDRLHLQCSRLLPSSNASRQDQCLRLLPLSRASVRQLRTTTDQSTRDLYSCLWHVTNNGTVASI